MKITACQVIGYHGAPGKAGRTATAHPGTLFEHQI
jgi:hypothetical protein